MTTSVADPHEIFFQSDHDIKYLYRELPSTLLTDILDNFMILDAKEKSRVSMKWKILLESSIRRNQFMSFLDFGCKLDMVDVDIPFDARTLILYDSTTSQISLDMLIEDPEELNALASMYPLLHTIQIGHGISVPPYFLFRLWEDMPIQNIKLHGCTIYFGACFSLQRTELSNHSIRLFMEIMKGQLLDPSSWDQTDFGSFLQQNHCNLAWNMAVQCNNIQRQRNQPNEETTDHASWLWRELGTRTELWPYNSSQLAWLTTSLNNLPPDYLLTFKMIDKKWHNRCVISNGMHLKPVDFDVPVTHNGRKPNLIDLGLYGRLLVILNGYLPIPGLTSPPFLFPNDITFSFNQSELFI